MKQKSIFTRAIFGTLISLAVISTGCNQQQEPNAQTQALPVSLKTLETTTIIDSSEFVGTLEASQRVQLAPRISGRILTIFASNGDQVTLGTPIVLLEPNQQLEEVNSRRAQVESAKAELNAAESDLAEAQANKQQTFADLESSKADLADIQARLDLAQVNYDRAQFLLEEGVVSQGELDDRTSQLKTNRAQLEAQQGRIRAQEEALNGAEQRIRRAQANIERARAQISTAEANLGVVTVDLKDNRVVAPIDGIVGDFPVKVGDFVNIGQELTTITNNEQFSLRISIPVERREELSLGLPVEIIRGEENLVGEITSIAPNVNQSTQTILVKATFENDGSLRDAQFVTVRVIWNQRSGVLVPTTAISSLGGQKFVFVAETDAENSQLVARQTPITVGSIQGQAYQVISGVEAGDQIAVSRILDLSNGRPIQQESIQSQNN